MKKFISILLAIVFLQSQVFSQPLGFLTFTPVNAGSTVLSMTNKGSEQRQSTKATLGTVGTVIATGKTIYDVAANDKIGIGETAEQWKANQKTFVNQNNYDRKTINSLSEGKSIEEIENAAGNTVKVYYNEEDRDIGFREKGDADIDNNYINAGQGAATDTGLFVKSTAHENAHNYTGNEAIAKNAGELAGFMWGLGNALNFTSVNTDGTTTSSSWYMQNQNSKLLQDNTSAANAIRQEKRILFVKEVSEWASTTLVSGDRTKEMPGYFTNSLSLFSTDFDNSLSAVQAVLDLGGMVPGIGVLFDAGSGVLSRIRGDEEGVFLSAIALEPTFVGTAAGMTKLARNSGKTVVSARKFADTITSGSIVDTVVKAVKNTDEAVLAYGSDKALTTIGDRVGIRIPSLNNYTVKTIYSSDKANASLVGLTAPYTPNTTVFDVVLNQRTTFARVYGGDSSLKGGFVMRFEDIQGLSAKQIQAKYALRYMPTNLAQATFESGTILRMGEANAIFGQPGGGLQFDLKKQLIGDFKNIGELK